jgi:hypothetical protein
MTLTFRHTYLSFTFKTWPSSSEPCRWPWPSGTPTWASPSKLDLHQINPVDDLDLQAHLLELHLQNLTVILNLTCTFISPLITFSCTKSPHFTLIFMLKEATSFEFKCTRHALYFQLWPHFRADFMHFHEKRVYHNWIHLFETTTALCHTLYTVNHEICEGLKAGKSVCSWIHAD